MIGFKHPGDESPFSQKKTLITRKKRQRFQEMWIRYDIFILAMLTLAALGYAIGVTIK